MTDAEMLAVFDRQYTPEGYPKSVGAAGAPAPGQKSAKWYFEEYCRANRVTDPTAIEELWAAEVAKREAATRSRKGG